MSEIDNLIDYIRINTDENTLKIIDFIERANVLTYNMKTDRIKDGDRIIEKPTNVLESSYLKMCSEDFEEGYDMLGQFFLHYQDYILRDLRAYWRFSISNLEKEFSSKCSYCNIKVKYCPMKVLGYIKKCINDKKINEYEFFDRLMEVEESKYKNDEYEIEDIVNKILNITNNRLDITGAEFLIQTQAIELEKEENGILYYRYLDFKVNNISFINNLYEYFAENKGLYGNLNLSDLYINDNFSYMFNKSPIELAAYIKYICEVKSVDVSNVLVKIYDRIEVSEDISKLAYYYEYINMTNKLECDEEIKRQVIEILNYIRNYSNIKKVPYIQFNFEILTKNKDISDEIINIINRFANSYGYLQNANTLYVDSEMLIKRTKDNSDVFYQLDKLYAENSFLVFTNIDKIKYLNEYRVDTFFSGMEKFYSKNKKSMTVLVGEKKGLIELTGKYEILNKYMITTKLDIQGSDVSYIKNKILKRISKLTDITDEVKEELDKYIESTYNPNILDENQYMDDVYEKVIFNKFKDRNIFKELDIDSIPKVADTRSIEEIFNDLNNLIGITEVKSKINELVKFIDYSNKINNGGVVNLNMIFKGNAGTGKTTIARIFAELFYKFGYIKKNSIIEVTSKDLIGDHLGQTAPKTQKVIESALDGVLFIDEAYSLMSSRGSADYASECISTICKAMETYKDRLVIIFAGYTKEMNDFINKNQGLMSRIGYEIEFPDFTKDELWEIFKTEAEGNEFIIGDGVEAKVRNIIAKNSITRNFGNARFVINLFNKLVLTHAVSYVEGEENLKVITSKDVDTLEATIKDKERGMDEILNDINSLIGLEDIKEVIYGFVSVLELNRKLDRRTDFNMHMIFKGNAGTGKTTVARLLAEIYYNLGYIKKNKLVEVQSQDLIGEYVGQTGPKTQNVIETALDGVLFIDEAYSIMNHIGGNASFTDECIATLLKAMEDYSGRLIIIFAGYTEEMKRFRDQNPGLKSRIGFELNFKDYSVEDLMNIFFKKLNEKQFKINEEAILKVRKIFENAKKVENFGNGRFVENTIQKIIVEHAMQTRNVDDYERLTTITEEDIKEIKAEESKNRIGF